MQVAADTAKRPAEEHSKYHLRMSARRSPGYQTAQWRMDEEQEDGNAKSGVSDTVPAPSIARWPPPAVVRTGIFGVGGQKTA